MTHSPNAILSRIECCRIQRKAAVTWDEEGAWKAEEAGLIDAFLGRDRPETGETYEPGMLARYELGLRDGQALLRIQKVHGKKPTGSVRARIVEALSQVPYLKQVDSA